MAIVLGFIAFGNLFVLTAIAIGNAIEGDWGAAIIEAQMFGALAALIIIPNLIGAAWRKVRGH